MSEEVLTAACKQLGVSRKQVLSHKIYDDHIALVVDKGGAGCPKYKLPFLPGVLEKPKAAPEAKQPVAAKSEKEGKKRTRASRRSR